jgi:hypothetical protein
MGAHGAGDCLLALQCASSLIKEEFQVLLSVRDEVFNLVDWHFGKSFPLKQVSERYGENNAILHTPPLLSDLIIELDCSFEIDEFYYVIPDLLFRNKYSFNYENFSTHPTVD